MYVIMSILVDKLKYTIYKWWIQMDFYRKMRKWPKNRIDIISYHSFLRISILIFLTEQAHKNALKSVKLDPIYIY